MSFDLLAEFGDIHNGISPAGSSNGPGNSNIGNPPSVLSPSVVDKHTRHFENVDKSFEQAEDLHDLWTATASTGGQRLQAWQAPGRDMFDSSAFAAPKSASQTLPSKAQQSQPVVTPFRFPADVRSGDYTFSTAGSAASNDSQVPAKTIAGSTKSTDTQPSVWSGRLYHMQESNTRMRDPNVLFDAEDEIAAPEDDDDGDDFGDFETGKDDSLLRQMSGPQMGSAVKEESLLDLMEDTQVPSREAPFTPLTQAFQTLTVTTALGGLSSDVSGIAREESPVRPWPVFNPEILAPDLNDKPIQTHLHGGRSGLSDCINSSGAHSKVEQTSPIEDGSAWTWDSVDDLVNTKQNDHESLRSSNHTSKPIRTAPAVPPTNIPPPSVLLAEFPQMLTMMQTHFRTLGTQEVAKARILSNPTTIDFLRAYILIAVVAARIIAGRKLRWKRDTILSQAMKIGPSAAGGKSGMKLTGVDKSEVAREDREAADVVGVWQEQVGRLRSVVAAANSSIEEPSQHLIVPEISERMPVREQGLLAAPKPCVLCGLKRSERVAKIDNEVEDSFGEWWVEHWGHRACLNFWDEHSSKLKQR